MWFHEDLDTIYSDGFQVGILNAGYNPVRIDSVEHINKIDDEIIRQIKASKFLVAIWILPIKTRRYDLIKPQFILAFFKYFCRVHVVALLNSLLFFKLINKKEPRADLTTFHIFE